MLIIQDSAGHKENEKVLSGDLFQESRFKWNITNFIMMLAI